MAAVTGFRVNRHAVAQARPQQAAGHRARAVAEAAGDPEAEAVERPRGVDRRASRGAARAGQPDRASGSAADPIGKYGVGSLTAAMLDEGAGTRSSLELADALEFLGANLSTTSSFDYSAVRMSVPVSKLGDALPLMADVALRPTFPAGELDRLRRSG